MEAHIEYFLEEHSERFLSKVEMTDDCWLWNACKFRGAYGQFSYDKKMLQALRFSYCLHNNCSLVSISEFVIRHSCNNSGCVNPAHLSTGTQQDNINDMVAAGRQARGEAHGNCKFPDDIIRAIRAAEGSQRAIAARFGLSKSHVSDIKAGKRRCEAL